MEPLRILLSRLAIEKLAGRVAGVLGETPHVLLAPDAPDAASAQVAFVSRDVTGLSTKHDVKPATQQVHDLLRAASSLRWVHIHSAGADRPVYLELMGRGVQLTTSSGANAPVVAQTVLLGVLTLARRWPQLGAAQREHRWASLIGTGLPRDLAGQTAVVVGWGPVGQEIGRLLQAVGLDLVVARRGAQSAGPGIRTVTMGQLDEVLPLADWLVLACPLTDETRGLVGPARLALLPAHACLVNVSRGDVIDEDALVAAVREQRLGGAYLDVFRHEPLAPESPLWDLPNVIVTPHSAGFSDANEERVAQMFLENLGRWARGEQLRNLAGG